MVFQSEYALGRNQGIKSNRSTMMTQLSHHTYLAAMASLVESWLARERYSPTHRSSRIPCTTAIFASVSEQSSPWYPGKQSHRAWQNASLDAQKGAGMPLPSKYPQVPLKWQWFGQGLGISTHVLLTLQEPVKHCELVLQLRPIGISRAGARQGVFASPDVPRYPVIHAPQVRAVPLQGLRCR